MNHQEFNKDLNKIITNYQSNIKDELITRWNDWEIDINEKEVYEVLGGLLCRQVIIMTHFCESPSMWNPDLAPIIHRTQIDNFINISWIIMEPLERCQKYIYHGLGVEKLNIEARKKQMDAEGLDHTDDPMIEWSRAWADSQRYSFLTEVNFGNWSGISTRKMADESGNIGLYNYSFQPFSTVAHNQWNHIGKMCMKQSSNPLHKLLHTPVIHKYPPGISMVDIGAKYLDRAFKKVDELFPPSKEIQSSWDALWNELDNLEDKHKNEEE